MSNMAIERMKDDTKLAARRSALMDLQTKIRATQGAPGPGTSIPRRTSARSPENETPIHKLPIELLSEIFLLASFDAPPVPVQLSHVCSHWRAVTLSLPSLWRVLILSKSKPAQKAKAWLQRSHGCVFELCLKSGLSQGMVGPIHVMMQSLDLGRQVLAEMQSLQWERLRHCTLGDRTSYTFFSALWESGRGESLKNLQSLDISESSETLWPQRRHWLLQDGADSDIDAGDDAPSRYNLGLTSLTLRGAAPNWDVMLPHVCKLVSLELYDQPREVTGLREALHDNPKLERLIIHANPSAPTLRTPTLLPNTIPLIHCQHLHHLELSDISDVAPLTQRIDFPALRTLRLSGSYAGFTFNILSQSPSSLANLQELSLRRCAVDARNVIRTLLNARHLHTFCLSHTDIDVNEIVNVLTEAPSANYHRYNPSNSPTSAPDLPVACPSLKNVDLTQSEKLGTGPLVRLVSSRIKLAASSSTGSVDATEDTADGNSQPVEVARIQTLIVNECPRIEADSLPWLRNNVPTFSCRYMSKKEASRKR